MSRERKRLNSERNALIRKGLGKNQSARNFNQEISDLSAGRGLNTAPLALNTIAITANNRTRTNYAPQLNPFGSNGDDQQKSLTITEYDTQASIQSDTTLAQTAQAFRDPKDLARSWYQTGSTTISDWLAPFSNGYHPNMSYRPNLSVNAHQSLLYVDEENLTLQGSGSTTYGGSFL
jgi:hypothetical protein